MCISPILIPNPNYGFKGRYAFMKDCASRYIKVPCGVCSECVHNRQLGLVQRCICESMSGYPFFCTLTYNNESLPVVSCSDGRDICFSDFSDVTNMIKRLRKSNAFGRPFRYLAVSELGSKRARPHFHLLFFVQKFPDDTIYTPLQLEPILFKSVLLEWRRNYGSSRQPDYRPLCTFVQKFHAGKIKSTFDLHYVCPSPLNGSSTDVLFYVTKYMLKPSNKAIRLQRALKLNLPEDEYDRIWSKVKPRWISSLNFGFGVYGLQPKGMSYSDRVDILSKTDSFKLVRDSIVRSANSSDFPAFYDPESGKALPLSRYWRSFGNLYTEQDAITFFYKNPHQFEDNVTIDERSMTSKFLAEESHNRQLRIISSHEENFDLFF